MPGTAAISSTLAFFSASTVEKCLRMAFLRFSPTPATPSRRLATLALLRSFR